MVCCIRFHRTILWPQMVPRIWIYTSRDFKLRRPLDVKQLREALARTELLRLGSLRLDMGWVVHNIYIISIYCGIWVGLYISNLVMSCRSNPTQAWWTCQRSHLPLQLVGLSTKAATTSYNVHLTQSLSSPVLTRGWPTVSHIVELVLPDSPHRHCLGERLACEPRAHGLIVWASQVLELTSCWPIPEPILRSRRNATNLVRKTIDKQGRRRVATWFNLNMSHMLCSFFRQTSGRYGTHSWAFMVYQYLYHPLHSASEAGIKSELAKSANYPRGFGLAIAALVSSKGRRQTEKALDLTYQGTDHLGSLDDFIKGPTKAKWRKPTFTGWWVGL